MPFDFRLIYASDLEESLGRDSTINFAAIVEALRAESSSDLLISAGDNYIPGPFFNAGNDGTMRRVDGDATLGALNIAYNALAALEGDAQAYDALRGAPGAIDIALMNIIGFDASAVGNHEFDAGTSSFETLLEADQRGDEGVAGDRSAGTFFPYLTTNLDFSEEGDLAGFVTDAPNGIVNATGGTQPRTLADAAIFDFDNNGVVEQVAVVGATTPIVQFISSPGDVEVLGTAGLTGYPTNDAELAAVTEALAAVIQPTIDALLADGIDQIVLASHLQQYEMEEALVGLLSGVDVIVSGGSGTEATLLSDGIEMVNADGDPAYVVSIDGYYDSVGVLDITFDDNGVPSAVTAQEILSTDAGVASVGGDVTTGRAAIAADLIEAARDVVVSNDQTIYGYTDVWLEGRRGSIRTEETNMGNLASDAQLWYARTVDPEIQVSLKNGGGLRAPIGTITADSELTAPAALTEVVDGYDKPAGAISQLDLEAVAAFNNDLVLVNTTAAGLHELMEHSVNASSPGSTPGQFPQIAGMRFSFDYDADFNPLVDGQQRVRDLALVDDDHDITEVIVANGQLVADPDMEIKMVSLDFLVNNNGDSYPFTDDADSGIEGVATSVIDLLDDNGEELGEQVAIAQYLQEFHATPESAIDAEEEPAFLDTRTMNLGADNLAAYEFAAEIAGANGIHAPIGTIDLEGSEIVAFAPDHQVAVLVTGVDSNAAGDVVHIVDLTDLTEPELISSIVEIGEVQSVDIAGDLVAVAVADQSDPETDPGVVSFHRITGFGERAQLNFVGHVEVGALPDSLAFNDHGTRLAVANEGQSNDVEDLADDALGTISIIDTSSFDETGSVDEFTVETIDFSYLDDLTEQLNNQGIRIARSAESVGQDIEPEFITTIGDTAYVSLQEANAIAEIDLIEAEVVDLWTTGFKDWVHGRPVLTDIEFDLAYPSVHNGGVGRPDPNGNGAVDVGEAIAGGISGAFYIGDDEEDGLDRYVVVTDRGPQAFDIGDRDLDDPDDAFDGEKVFDDPMYPITVYTLTDDDGVVLEESALQLMVPDSSVEGGFRLSTGLPGLDGQEAGVAYDIAMELVAVGNAELGTFNQYQVAPLDAFGIDAESINLIPDAADAAAQINGGDSMYAISDEYGPQILLFDSESGHLVQRYVPEGTVYDADYPDNMADVEGFTFDTLPSVYSDRRTNRGFESMAFNTDDNLLYAFIQSPMRPEGYRDGNSEIIRVLAVDPYTGTPQAEYLHLLPSADISAKNAGVDKVGDAVYDPHRGVFLISERDSSDGDPTATKRVVEVDLLGATNVLDTDWQTILGVTQPEAYATDSLVDDLAAEDIYFTNRVELFNLPSLGAHLGFDKMTEGLALNTNDGSLMVFSDNDFVSQANRPANIVTQVAFEPLPIDTSNRDEAGGEFGLKNVYGIKHPDGLHAFELNGETYVITANEGDARDGDETIDEVRVGDLVEDLGTSQENQDYWVEELGERLHLVATEGDYDRDGDIDQAFAFGGRSFSIYDEVGNLVFDSGNELDELMKGIGLYRDSRSDDKGMEPECVLTQEIDGRMYAFIGLERGEHSTVVVYDVTTPADSHLVDILANTMVEPGVDEDGNADLFTGSMHPEGLLFIETAPNGGGVLLVASEGDDYPVESQFDVYSYGLPDGVTPELALTSASDLVLGTAGDDDTLVDDLGFSGHAEVLFTGAGTDTADSEIIGGEENTIFTGSGDDTIYANEDDVVIGGSGNDTAFATAYDGNRLSGNDGFDVFNIGTSHNRVLGGDHDDVFNVLDGAGVNYLNGGDGFDQFWLIPGAGDRPAEAQMVMDFDSDEDVIGLSGVSYDNIDLEYQGGNTLLRVNGAEVGLFMNTTTEDFHISNFAGLA